MGRLRDLGWAIRDRVGGIALVLALLACGAAAAGIVIALDARDKAEEAAESPASLLTAPAAGDTDATVDELNERVGAIEESVSALREELGTGATTTEETTTPEDSTTTPPPEVPELPEGVEIPGVGEPESEAPAP
jgi:hypothetical protein